MTIHLLKPGDGQRWDAFVKRSPHAHAYHQAGWADVIQQSFGHPAQYVYSQDSNGEIDGVLPLVLLRSRLFGRFLVSLPYLNYGGPCASEPSAGARLVEEAVRIARDERAANLELRLTVADGFSLRVKASKVSMRLELPAAADDLWKALASKLRNQVNRPIKEGMIARVGGEEELDSFHKVFSINMRDLGTPVYGRRFFANVLRAFPASTRICSIYHDGQPVASGLLVGFRGMLEIPWASSLRSMNRLAPNMLLYWSALKYACEAGYRVFDFGRSSPGGGTYRFKEQWGAKPLSLYWHYWLPRDEPLPDLNPANPKYRLAINIWKRLPVGVTRMLGPSIVKNIP